MRSPAKINLSLKITGKNNQGYHELESLFAFLDLSDDLEVKLSHNFKLEINGKFSHLIDQENNLFTQILDYFSQEFSISKNLHIKLEKNIPVGAGLGGGSSNAAYFMKALNDIFNLKLSKIQLQKISLNFGSDIAFFFEDQASIIKGRGEIINNYPEFKDFSILLINPKITLSTKEVFENFNNSFSDKTPSNILLKANLKDLTKIKNDLENSSIKIEPIIKTILDNLISEKARLAKMSGSGSTCFGIFDNDKDLETAKINLRKKFPNFFIQRVKVISKIHF